MTTQPPAEDAQDRPTSRTVPQSPTSHGTAPAAPAKTPLPNERDEAGHTTASEPDAKIEQAGADVQRGLKDTSRGEASDAAYQKQK